MAHQRKAMLAIGCAQRLIRQQRLRPFYQILIGREANPSTPFGIQPSIATAFGQYA